MVECRGGQLGHAVARVKGVQVMKSKSVKVRGVFMSRTYSVKVCGSVWVAMYRNDSPFYAESEGQLLEFLQAECDRDPRGGRCLNVGQLFSK